MGVGVVGGVPEDVGPGVGVPVADPIEPVAVGEVAGVGVKTAVPVGPGVPVVVGITVPVCVGAGVGVPVAAPTWLVGVGEPAGVGVGAIKVGVRPGVGIVDNGVGVNVGVGITGSVGVDLFWQAKPVRTAQRAAVARRRGRRIR